MARPIKEGLDYFTTEAGIFSTPKIRSLIRKFGTNGIAAYFWINAHSLEKAYYLQWDDDTKGLMCDELRIDENQIDEIVEFMVEKKIFVEINHSDMGDVLTSEKLQKDFIPVLSDRLRKSKGNPTVEDRTDPEIWLITPRNNAGINAEAPGGSERRNVTDRIETNRNVAYRDEPTDSNSGSNAHGQSVVSQSQIENIIKQDYPDWNTITIDHAVHIAYTAVKDAADRGEPVRYLQSYIRRVIQTQIDEGKIKPIEKNPLLDGINGELLGK